MNHQDKDKDKDKDGVSIYLVFFTAILHASFVFFLNFFGVQNEKTFKLEKKEKVLIRFATQMFLFKEKLMNQLLQEAGLGGRTANSRKKSLQIN